jgi:hypothetical protein
MKVLVMLPSGAAANEESESSDGDSMCKPNIVQINQYVSHVTAHRAKIFLLLIAA